MAAEKQIPGDLALHTRLAQGMAARIGSVPQAAMGSVIDRCRHCPHPQSCAAFQLDTPQSQDVPSYCLNADRFKDWSLPEA